MFYCKSNKDILMNRNKTNFQKISFYLSKVIKLQYIQDNTVYVSSWIAFQDMNAACESVI